MVGPTQSFEATIAADEVPAAECSPIRNEKLPDSTSTNEKAVTLGEAPIDSIAAEAGLAAIAKTLPECDPVQTQSFEATIAADEVPAAERSPIRNEKLPDSTSTNEKAVTLGEAPIDSIAAVAGLAAIAKTLPECDPVQTLSATQVAAPTLTEPIMATEPTLLSDETRRLAVLKRQIEFYFSDRNLARDQPLREEISRDGSEGWVAGAWFLSCPKVTALGACERDLLHAFGKGAECLGDSADNVEVEWIASAVQAGCGCTRLRRHARRSTLPARSQARGREGGHLLVADCARLPHRQRGTRSSALIVFSPSSPSSPPSPASLPPSPSDEEGAPNDSGIWGSGFRAELKASLREAGVPGRAILGVSQPNSCAEAVIAVGPFSGDEEVFAHMRALQVDGRSVPVRLLFGSARNQALQLLPARVRKDLGDRTGCGKRRMDNDESFADDLAKRRR